MYDRYRFRIRVPAHATYLILLGIFCVGMTSCGFPNREGRRTDTYLGPYPSAPKPNNAFRQASYSELRADLPVVADAEMVNDDDLCISCHKTYTETFKQNVHRGLSKGQSCEACHGPASQHVGTRGKQPGMIFSFKTATPAQKSEMCARCHEENVCAPGANWRTSVHAHKNVSCTDCHRGHYNVPVGTPATTEPEITMARAPRVQLASFAEGAATLPSLKGTSNNMGAQAPDTCFKCHGDLSDMARIAGPHQICGPNNFNCTTCHDPHGKILDSSRKELCLSCHKQGSPVMAWHSSSHDLNGVSCTDCHNPHPKQSVQQFVGISHYGVQRQKRLTMSVQEPEACYKCHPKIYAMNALPSHHPIKEGNMTCSDCHDPHGQLQNNLKAESVNLLCWKCHAEKQGPFAYEHPPVTENCGICHQPHGTVANKLLKQPTTFLCLRCHDGHRQSNHGRTASTPPGGLIGARADIDRNPALRQALYTDCTQCHTQIHGSDMPTAHSAGVLSR